MENKVAVLQAIVQLELIDIIAKIITMYASDVRGYVP